jgi:purine catabolism regulator
VATTVADLLAIDELRLGLVAGAKGLERPIRWAHVSELRDPTRFLRGGEVLLTTGLGLRGAPAGQAAYVEQLARADLAALGIGLGFAFKATPPVVLEAADRAGFPVFEVPFEVPFIAITCSPASSTSSTSCSSGPGRSSRRCRGCWSRGPGWTPCWRPTPG